MRRAKYNIEELFVKWIAFLHAQNALAVAWTLDADDPAEVALAERLVAAGVDHVTTNDAPKLALALGQPAVF